MITLWNAALLAVFGPLFFAPLLVRKLIPAKAQARRREAK